ncbi:IQ motif [Trypanosoma melophagium]|uniref:IQ motif n=1 Tax=Trypanosoma melophagium TaxID=715481 RepID=UPI00351A6A65|nr:IQ motif [Trypanosoma melophagium]
MTGTHGDHNTENDGGHLQMAINYCAASKHLLAIKAYERVLSEQGNETIIKLSPSQVFHLVPPDALFRDFILCCNVFCVKSVETNMELAIDFLRICLEQLKRCSYLNGEFETYNHDKKVPISSNMDRGLLLLVCLTLNNWGCLLLRSGEIGRAMAVFQTALETSIAEELTCVILLNLCTLHIQNCCFPEASDTAMTVLHATDSSDAEESKEEKSDADRPVLLPAAMYADARPLLAALAEHNAGIAAEYMATAAAVTHYTAAEARLAEGPHQQWAAVAANCRRRLHALLQRRREEAIMRRREEEAEAEAEAEQHANGNGMGRGSLNLRRVRSLRNIGPNTSTNTPPPMTSVQRRPGSRVKSGLRRGRRRLSPSTTTGEEPVELPPINAELRQRIRSGGLTDVVIPFLRTAEVRDIVFGEERIFESPFSFMESAVTCNVTMIMLCEETPLQKADEAERENVAPVRRTVWSLFGPRRDSMLDMPHAKPKATAMPPAIVVDAINSLMPPPPIPEKIIENAQRTVAGLKKLLTNRLTVLIRAENAFEERWEATTVVKSALVAYSLAQDILKLKISMKEKREKQIVLEDSSARRIVRFFRKVLEGKRWKEGSIPKGVALRYVEEKVAITMQKYVRRWLAKREIQRLRDERRRKDMAAMKIQSIYHARVARQRYLELQQEERNRLEAEKEKEKLEFAATQIQRAYRRHTFLLHKLYERGHRKEFILHHYKYSREYYATVIQKTFRGYLVRRIYGAAVYAKRCYGRNCYRAEVLNICATRIQTAFRGYLTLRTTKDQLQKHLEQGKQKALEMNQRNVHEAAIVIQCAYRCYKARCTTSELRRVREKEHLLRRSQVYPPFRLEERVY